MTNTNSNQAFEEFCAKQRTLTEGLFQQLDPNEDSMPSVVFVADGKSEVAFIPDLGDPNKKDLYLRFVIPDYIKSKNVEMGCLSVMTWTVVRDLETAKAQAGIEQLVPPSMDPDRQECIMLICFKKNEERLLIGNVVRSENASPRINWMPEVDGEAGGRFSGLFKAIL